MTHQVIQVTDTGGGVTCLRGVGLSEPGGDGGGPEDPAPAWRLMRACVVVVRLKVFLADEQLADNVERSVYIHVQSAQPLPQSLRVSERKAMKGELWTFGVRAGVNATLEDHLVFNVRWTNAWKGSDTPADSLSSGRCNDFKSSAVCCCFFFSAPSSSPFFCNAPGWHLFGEILPPFVRKYN